MIVEAPMLEQCEVAAILQKRFGRLTSWPAFLADIRRTEREGKAPPHLYGHQLHPHAFGEKRIPLYHPLAVAEFIRLIKLEIPGIECRAPNVYKFDNTPGVPWQMRKAELVK